MRSNKVVIDVWLDMCVKESFVILNNYITFVKSKIYHTMNERLEQFMKSEGLTSAKLAEILSVQPSSISHLLSGRNNPNFDFISKLLLMFPRLNPHWIINGHGDMYLDDQKSFINQNFAENYKAEDADIISQNQPKIDNQSADNQNNQSVKYVTQIPDLFVQNPPKVDQPEPEVIAEQKISESKCDVNDCKSIDNAISNSSSVRLVERVLLLYTDKSFEFYDR